LTKRGDRFSLIPIGGERTFAGCIRAPTSAVIGSGRLSANRLQEVELNPELSGAEGFAPTRLSVLA